LWSIKQNEEVTVLKSDQETTTTHCADEKTTRVYTCIPADIRLLRKLLKERPGEVTLEHEDKYGIKVLVPKSWIKIRPLRLISETERARRRERAIERGLGKRHA
jgi:hypothetical protein